jgi:hypothetical protein
MTHLGHFCQSYPYLNGYGFVLTFAVFCATIRTATLALQIVQQR